MLNDYWTHHLHCLIFNCFGIRNVSHVSYQAHIEIRTAVLSSTAAKWLRRRQSGFDWTDAMLLGWRSLWTTLVWLRLERSTAYQQRGVSLLALSDEACEDGANIWFNACKNVFFRQNNEILITLKGRYKCAQAIYHYHKSAMVYLPPCYTMLLLGKSMSLM